MDRNGILSLTAYMLVLFSNAILQGLLDLHSIVENPFGRHVCKFPLKAHVTDLLSTSKAFLRFGPSTGLPPSLHNAVSAAAGDEVKRSPAMASAASEPASAASASTDTHVPRELEMGHGPYLALQLDQGLVS